MRSLSTLLSIASLCCVLSGSAWAGEMNKAKALKIMKIKEHELNPKKLNDQFKRLIQADNTIEKQMGNFTEKEKRERLDLTDAHEFLDDYLTENPNTIVVSGEGSQKSSSNFFSSLFEKGKKLVVRKEGGSVEVSANHPKKEYIGIEGARRLVFDHLPAELRGGAPTWEWVQYFDSTDLGNGRRKLDLRISRLDAERKPMNPVHAYVQIDAEGKILENTLTFTYG